MEKDPQDRVQTATEVIARLEPWAMETGPLPTQQLARSPWMPPPLPGGSAGSDSDMQDTNSDSSDVVDLDEAEANAAARVTGLAILATLRAHLGSLDRVTRFVKVLGMVNCTPDFGTQPAVINGFSELMIDIFGEQAGKDARSAVGMSGLSFGIPVEMEANFQVCD